MLNGYKIFFLFFVFINTSFSLWVTGYASQPPIDPAEKIFKDVRQREVQEELRKTPEKVPIPEEKALRFKPFVGCIPIKKFTLIGSKLLREQLDKQIKAARPFYWQRCISSTDLNDLILKLNTILLDRGYVTTRLEADGYEKKTGELTIRIQEGRIESIETSLIDRYTAFPGLIGKELKAADLEQGLEQLNRLSSQTSVITLWPGKEYGGTIVKIDTKKIGKPYYLYLSFDNSGNKLTGLNVLKGNFIYDNPFFLNDKLLVAGSKSGLGEEQSAALTWKEEVPFGYYTFDYSGSYSDAQYSLLPGENTLELATHSLKNKLNLSRTIYRGLSNYFSLNGSFWRYLSQRKFKGIDFSLSDKHRQKLSVVEVGIQHNFYYPSLRILTELNYAEGIRLFGVKGDFFTAGTSHESSSAEFRRYKLTSDYLWQITRNVHLNGNIQMQYAEKTLPGVVKLAVFNEIDGIRGIRENDLVSDNGIIIRHDMVFPLAFQKIVVSPFLHGDIGWGSNKGDKMGLEKSIPLNFRWLR